MSQIVWVYSDQPLTPRAHDVLTKIIDSLGLEDKPKLKFASNPNALGQNKKVLVFGSQAPLGVWDGVEFIYTYSIAQMMSKPNAMTVITQSIKLYLGIQQVLQFSRYPIHSWVVNSPDKWLIDYSKPVVIDIETDGNLGKTHTPDDVNVISVALYQDDEHNNYSTGAPIVYALGDITTGGTLPITGELFDMLKRELPKFEYVIYHNGKFDIRVLNRYFGIDLKNSFDTMLAHHVLNHAAGMHGLKELAHRYLGAADWETGIKGYTKNGGHYELIPIERLVEYNGIDVYWTYQLWKMFEPLIESDEDNKMAFFLEMRAAEFLLDVEMNGIPFDAQAAKALTLTQEITMAKTQKALAELTAIQSFNPGSWQQVKLVLEWFREYRGSTNEKSLQETIDKFEEIGDYENVAAVFCRLVLEYRKASKIKGTYAEGWAKTARDGRVHPTYLVHGTSTGRLSSTGPNAQNVPRNKEVRKIVAVVEGNELG